MDKASRIRKVLLKEASEAEQLELNAWIAASPSNAEEFEDLKIFYLESAGITNNPDPELDRPLLKIQQAIRQLKKRERQRSIRKTIVTSGILSGLIFTVVVCMFTGNTSPGNANQAEKKGGVEAITLTENVRFKDTPVSIILTYMRKRAPVVFKTTASDILACTFTGTFYKGKNNKKMMEVLAESENFQYRFEVNNIVLTGTGCR